MNRRLYTIGGTALALGLLMAILFLPGSGNDPLTTSPAGEKLDKATRIEEAFAYNEMMIRDLELGYVPHERLYEAIKFTRKRQQEVAEVRLGDPTNPRWRERGPNNIGGRTRVLHIDLNDPTGNTIFAGSVSGGLWKTTDITAAPVEWVQVNDYLANLAIGGLDQDPVDPNIMYMGTGEGYPNIDAVRGIGIFKSTDGGENWEFLPGSVDALGTTTRDITVHPITRDVYAATSGGLLRSQDFGVTWTKVHGTGFGANNNFYDIHYVVDGDFMIASNTNNVYKSETGDPNTWPSLTSGQIEGGMSRVEVTVCASDPNIMYLIGAKGGAATKVYRTNDGGTTWVPRIEPGGGNDFTNGQAWYDLDIAVNPFDCEHTIAGGVPSLQSTSGGFTYGGWSGGMHVDQHAILWDPERPDRVLLGNDGGIYYGEQGTDAPPANKNFGYNVTQFYAGAMHPDYFSHYLLGGTQDNSSLQLNDFSITSGANVRGGDGFFSHIDQNEPNIQMVSSQFGSYGLSTNGGGSFGGGADMQGSFVCPSDYDNDANIMYAQTNAGDLARWNIATGQVDFVDILGFSNIFVTNVFADPNVPNRIYVGISGTGRVIRIDDAHDGLSLNGENISTFSGTVSSITVENGDPDHILVTISNYGSNFSIMETKDGGDTWQNQEGLNVPNNLPDVPVRWGIFNPANPEQAMIATEVGVWITDKLDGDDTVWYPPTPGRGTPLVSTWMLQVRESDRLVAAWTHGRGIWTCDVWTDPVARIDADGAGYEDWTSLFNGEASYNADYYNWDFSDGGNLGGEKALYEFPALGDYTATLTIGDDVDSDVHNIRILPEAGLPYEPGTPEYGADFEGSLDQFAVQTINGSGWEVGSSDIMGKEGTHGGVNTFVINPSEDGYEINSESILYLPKFDLTEAGIYEFSFWSRFDLQQARDGFQVQYRTKEDAEWKILGNEISDDWYNVRNTEYSDGGFPLNDPMFSRFNIEWTKYKLNISELSGQGEIAFRFVFKSDANVNSASGVAIDDIVITRFEGAAETVLTQFAGEFSSGTDVTLTWTTIPEFNCQYFEIEVSEDGKNWEPLTTVDAMGVNSSEPQTYEYTFLGQRDLYFFRMHVVNENEAIDYFYEFDSEVLVLRRDIEGTGVYLLYPNPFTTQIEMTFNDILSGQIRFELFDAAGRLITEGTETVEGITYYSIPTPPVAAGIYFLRLQLGEQEVETFRLLGGVQ